MNTKTFLHNLEPNRADRERYAAYLRLKEAVDALPSPEEVGAQLSDALAPVLAKIKAENAKAKAREAKANEFTNDWELPE